MLYVSASMQQRVHQLHVLFKRHEQLADITAISVDSTLFQQRMHDTTAHAR
jgi:hypothetical protein